MRQEIRCPGCNHKLGEVCADCFKAVSVWIKCSSCKQVVTIELKNETRIETRIDSSVPDKPDGHDWRPPDPAKQEFVGGNICRKCGVVSDERGGRDPCDKAAKPPEG